MIAGWIRLPGSGYAAAAAFLRQRVEAGTRGLAAARKTATWEDHDDTAEPLLRPVGRRRRIGNAAPRVLAAGRRSDGGNAVRARPWHAGRPHPHAFRGRGDVLHPPRPASVPGPA